MEQLKSDRRTFMRRGAMGAGAAWMCSLQELSARAQHTGPAVVNGVSPYGPVQPTLDQTHRTAVAETAGRLSLLVVYWTGDLMSDGLLPEPARRHGCRRPVAHETTLAMTTTMMTTTAGERPTGATIQTTNAVAIAAAPARSC